MLIENERIAKQARIEQVRKRLSAIDLELLACQAEQAQLREDLQDQDNWNMQFIGRTEACTQKLAALQTEQAELHKELEVLSK